MSDKCPVEEYERAAKAFRQATGMSAPGKNESPLMVDRTNYERREVRAKLWGLWWKMQATNAELEEENAKLYEENATLREGSNDLPEDGKYYEQERAERDAEAEQERRATEEAAP